MTHSEDFLSQLCKKKVVGDFYPFNEKSIKIVEEYIKQIVGRIKDNYNIIVEPDFKNYGSGFASYINVKISKKDGSDTAIVKKDNIVTECKNGILIYISKLSPYWYFGSHEWTNSYENDKWRGATDGFLQPESIESFDIHTWRSEMAEIKNIFEEYRYILLTQEELEHNLWFKINIPTVLSDEPYYRVFDCFFYWAD